jgi:hypothetical protein
LRSVANQYTTNSEVHEFHLPLGSREATPSSSKEASSDIAIQSTREGTEGGKRRCKQCPQGAMITTDYGDSNNGKAGKSGMGRVMTVVHSNKHKAWPPTDNFKRLLEEAYPNHVYPIKHKLKDCDIMKSFMISGYTTRGTKLNEDTGRSDTMPFPKENTVMTVYSGRPHQGGIACLS